MTILLVEQIPVATQLTLIDKWYSRTDSEPDLTFENWFCRKFNCSIIYRPNSDKYEGFNFHSEKDLTWFLLNV